MALKPDRNVDAWDISKFWAPLGGAATRGGIVVSTGNAPSVGSGAALDQSVNQVHYRALTPSGRQPIGMLMNDVVSVDLTRQILNPNKSEVQVGDKVTLMTKGWAVTNMIETARGTPNVIGAPAYLNMSGMISANPSGAYFASGILYTANPVIGRFHSKIDEDGYCKVYVDL